MNPFDLPSAVASRPLRVGLLGLGTVGAGTYRVLQRNQRLIAQRAGRAIDIRMASARNLAKAQGVVSSEVVLVQDPFAITRHPEIDVVVEAIGGTSVARDLVLSALAHGKHVVTANKALLAEHGNAIWAIARAQGLSVAYEGAVAVSIPIIKALRESLTANRIEWLAGIINGTSNFILSRMADQQEPFAQALAEAQRLGYAEADPRLDVQGVDAAHKLALLAANAFATPVQFAQVRVQGIDGLQLRDLRYAQELGYRVKLLGVAQRQESAQSMEVQPFLVPHPHLLAQVQGSMNGILVHGDAAGDQLFYGAGAGSEETGSAVIADLVDLARRPAHCGPGVVPDLGFEVAAQCPLASARPEDLLRPYYLRCTGDCHLTGRFREQRERIQAHVQHSWLPAAEAGTEAQDLVLLTRPLGPQGLSELLAVVKAWAGAAGEWELLPVFDLGG